MMPAMTYPEFVSDCQKRQRQYIKGEFRRMEKARALWLRYTAAMHGLGLHPLTSNEIENRWRELQDMSHRVVETHGDSEAMRAIYEMHFPSLGKEI